MRRWLTQLLLAISLVLLFKDAPGPFLREAWFVLELLLVTLATRTVTWASASSALSLGIGVAAPMIVAAGIGLSAIGLDVSASGIGNWGVVPLVEELIKLLPVAIVTLLYRRRSRMTLNPSDFLLLGCAAGAGFAMVENAQLVLRSASVLRDMAEQYGPTWLVPGAWGASGYVGHAAATGFITAGYGLGVAWQRDGGPMMKYSRAAAFAPFAWILAEHVLANLHTDTGSAATLMLGNGRLTPWLFLAMVAAVIATDVRTARLALSRSRTLRLRWRLTRGALTGRLPARVPLMKKLAVAAFELRLLNTTAWFTLDRRRS